MTDTMRVEEARRVLAQFDAEARAQAEAREREIAAEHARQTARRRRWAETYEPTAAAARASHARVALGQSVNIDDRGPNLLVEYINNVPSMPTILRALAALLADAAPYAPMAAVDAWVAAPDDTNRPMPA